MNKKYLRIIKFVISGASAAAVEYTIFIIMDLLIVNAPVVLFQSVSFLCGAVVSFTLNKYWVFTSSGSTKSEALKYLTLVLINVAISNLILWALINTFHAPNWAAKLMTMVTIAVWNFSILQRLVFTQKKPLKG